VPKLQTDNDVSLWQQMTAQQEEANTEAIACDARFATGSR